MPGAPTKVFISYSHDSRAHEDRILLLANKLRELGVDVELDRYHVRPEQGWPRWCEEQLRPENSGYVLAICTETYRNRIDGKAPADEGRGVYWEGDVIYNYIYDAKQNKRFVPILLSGAKDEDIPLPLRGATRYHITDFDLNDSGFEALYRELTSQPAIVKPVLGAVVALSVATVEPPKPAPPLPAREAVTTFDPPTAHDISRIFDYAPTALIGREDETKIIDDAWAAAIRGDTKRARIVAFVAMGGEGKTSLIADWAVRKATDGWPDCDRAFAWSFYSQGTREQYAGDSDLFLAEALAFFGGETKQGEAAVEKAKRLARLIGACRALLILDGLEPLQYPSGPPHDGALKDDAMAALLKALATTGKALVLVTTRVPIVELKASALLAATPQHDLTRLSTPAGAALLKALGVKGAKDEYEALVEETQGHALTLTFLGSYLKRAHQGDIRRFDRVEWTKASQQHKNNHAFRAMATYEKFLSRGDAGGAREIAVLRLMGLFDRPADAGCVTALLREKIAGLNEALVAASEDDFTLALDNLESEKLLTVSRDASRALVALDAHPLLREYFAKELREKNPEGWKAAHKRLYELLCATTKEGEKPEIGDLRPLYQAVTHGCHAGLQQEACDEVYIKRILRGDVYYSTKKLGAFGADLGAVACFFDAPWTTLSPHLTPRYQAWLRGQGAFRLRALGRLQEALEPMRAGLVMGVEQEDWSEAARRASNISELALTLGDVAAAVQDGAASVAHADRSGDAAPRMINRTTHADALHQQGDAGAAAALFAAAEAIQKELQPQYPLLYSLRGFQYCDLLLAPAERAAWRVLLAAGTGAGDFPLPHPEERALARVSKDEGEEKPAARTSSSFETRRIRGAPQDEDVLRPVPPSLRGGEADEAVQILARGSGVLPPDRVRGSLAMTMWKRCARRATRSRGAARKCSNGAYRPTHASTSPSTISPSRAPRSMRRSCAAPRLMAPVPMRRTSLLSTRR